MQKYAILSLQVPFTLFEQFLYMHGMGKKLQKKIFQIKTIEETEFHIINIPFCMEKKQSNKKIEKFTEIFMQELNQKGIETVWIQNNVPFPEILKQKLAQNFHQVTGENILLFSCMDVIKKYVRVNNSTTHESEIVLLADNVKRTKIVIEKICKSVKAISLVAEEKENFKPLCDDIFSEYGLYISLSDNLNDFIGKKKIYINLANNTDFFIKKAETNHIPLCNLGGNQIIKDNCINYVSFDLKPVFKELYPYAAAKNQVFLEYIITVQNNHINEKLVEQFFKDYFVTLRKIYAKNC